MQDSNFPVKLSVSPAPHIRAIDRTFGFMLDIVIALIPAAAWGVYRFGIRALLIILISVASSVAFEFLYEKILKKPVTVSDLSAVVTGLILGLCMPPAVSLWIPVAGSFFAIVIVKQLFGGIGKNIVNPAITAYLFLMLCFAEQMTRFVDTKTDLITSATPLVSLKAGEMPDVNIFNSVLGNTAGSIGEVSVIALGAGFIYLFCRKVVRWEIPVLYIGVFSLLTLVFPATGDAFTSFSHELVSGSLLFCALIAANDTVTTPVTSGGRILFGLGCGIITFVIRYFSSYAEGSAFAIVIMNLLCPALDALCSPKPFGVKKK